MDITPIVDEIVGTPDGGTARLNGTTPLPTTGYYVGGKVSALVEDDPRDVDPGSVWIFLAYLESQQIAPFVGWWTDAETGKLWIDATTWHANYNDAEAQCRDRHEIAFYDVKRGRSIRPVVQR